MSGITLKLDPTPTFWAKVAIPVPGSDKGAEIECEFVHMTREEYASFTSSAGDRTDHETAMLLLRGWKGPDMAFSSEALAKLLANYHGAAFAIAEKFATELGKVRAGN